MGRKEKREIREAEKLARENYHFETPLITKGSVRITSKDAAPELPITVEEVLELRAQARKAFGIKMQKAALAVKLKVKRTTLPSKDAPVRLKDSFINGKGRNFMPGRSLLENQKLQLDGNERRRRHLNHIRPYRPYLMGNNKGNGE